MSRVRLSPSASITPTKDAVILRSDLGAFSIAGADLRAFLDRIVPVLDGSRDRSGVEAALPGYSPKSVQAFLDVLQKHGLIEEVPDAALLSARDRWRGQDELLKRCGATASLSGARVALVGTEARGLAAVMALAAAGVGGIDLVEVPGALELGAAIQARAPWCRAQVRRMEALSEEPPSLVIAVIDPAEEDAVERVSRAAHAAGVRSLWGHVAGATLSLGPLVVPGATACRVCAMAEALSPDVSGDQRDAGDAGEVLGAMLALEAIKAMTGYTEALLAGRMAIRDLHTFETKVHTLVPLPWCRVCGERSS